MKATISIERLLSCCYSLLGLACLLLAASLVMAQQPTGTIEGTITDPSGAVVSGAQVTITEKATAREIKTTTNADGYFVARSLPAGAYDIKIEQAGFSSGVIEAAVVQTGQVFNASLSLKVGQATEVVQVQGTDAQLQVDISRQTLDGVVTAQQIVQLPLNQRNFLDLAALQPGVVTRDGENVDPTKANAYRVVTVNGSSGTGTRVQIDGIDTTDETVGSTIANISTDAVQEFQLSRASFDLSTSLTTSGAVNIVTRSGGNGFHGSGFYFWRDESIAARPQFLQEQPEFYRHQVGYRFGGPIVKDKLFFFSNMERTYQGSQDVVTSGDFPQLQGTVPFPVGIRYTTHRLDYNLSDRAKLFYTHRYNDDLSTGGDGASPFQNVNWTNVHVVGADMTSARTSHTIRFGYVNFNNRIQSQELDPFAFPRINGIAYNLSVGDYTLGPNSLAPQQTYQDNFQTKYDGSVAFGNHALRFGGEVNRIILGGFANFAGPLSLVGLFNTETRNALPAAQRTDPLAYPLDAFTTGPNSGFFTAAPAHNLPYGGKRNTRFGIYVGDNWKVSRRFTLNYGTRWQYDTAYVNEDAPVLNVLNVYGPRTGETAKFPKNAFSPQLGFAWDVTGDGKTSVRGGFYLSYEMNIFNNSFFDEFSRLPPGIGPTALSFEHIVGPDGAPINIGTVAGCPAAEVAAGDYTCLTGRPIRETLPFVARIHQAVQTAYANFKFDPNRGPSEFENTGGVTFGGTFPGTFKIPYGMQFSFGVQREIVRNMVLSADYVRIRGVGLPFLLGEFERRRNASTLNATAARAAVARTVGVPVANLNAGVIDAYLAANPTANIARFGLGNDTIFPGLTPNITRARLLTGGFSTYQGLQMRLEGRLADSSLERLRNLTRSLARGLNYTVSYALSRAEATNGSSRTEFINNTIDNNNWNRPFGPTGNDRTHILTIGALMEVPLGFQLNQIWAFRTATPQNVFVPAFDNLGGASRIFTTDLNGDGNIGGGAPRADLLPGTTIGALGREIGSFRELNYEIEKFNFQNAGRITPAGQALINAGIFNEAQLRRLGATVRPIPTVPLTNPWPFDNVFNLDLRVTRPIRLFGDNGIVIEPNFEVFNVFNRTGRGQYGGLDGTFGSLNYDYVRDPNGQGGIAALDQLVRQRLTNTRQLQFGIRVTF